LISKSGLFDTAYYLDQNPSIAESGMNPLAHYLSFGVHEGRDPNPIFNSSYYLDLNPDLAESGMNPLAHYLSIGAHEGRDPNPLFDTSYYLEQNPDVVKSGINPLRHYLEIGAWEGRLPCLLNEGNLDPQILKICQTRLDDPKALEFDEDFCTKFYTDLKNIDDPEKARRYYFVDRKVEGHFASFHEFLMYLPAHPLDVPIDFSPDGYFELNPDVAETEVSSKYHALAHYLRHGKKEGRLYSISQGLLRPNKFFPETTPYSCSLSIHDLKDRTAVCVLVHIYDTEIWPELATYIRNFGKISFDIYINIVDTKWSESLHSQIRNEFPKAHIYISPNKGRAIGGFFTLLSNIDTENYDVLCLLHTKKSSHLAPVLGNKWRTDLLDAILHNEQSAEENVSLFLHDETVGLIGSRLWSNTELKRNERAYFKLLEKLSIQGENRKCEYLSGTIMLVRPNVLQKIYEIADYDEFEMGDKKSFEFHLDGQLAHAVERVIGCVVRHLGYRVVWR